MVAVSGGYGVAKRKRLAKGPKRLGEMKDPKWLRVMVWFLDKENEHVERQMNALYEQRMLF